MKTCDVMVIGAGPGGYVAAIRAAQLGATVIVAERWEIGGVCLNAGCIPTKTLITSAELYRKMGHAKDFGLSVENASFDMKAIVKRKNDVIRRNRNGIQALFKAHKIEVLKGDASVVAPGRVMVGEEEIHAKAVIIASGGRPAHIPGLDFNGTTVIGAKEALEQTDLPERIGVIGAGALGAEFACAWNAFGAKVTLVELMPHVLPKEDTELGDMLEGCLKKLGMDVRTGTSVSKLTHEADGTITLELTGKKPGEIKVDKVLVSIGLQCNSEVLANPSELGIQLNKRGGIPVNEFMETTVPGLYAIGDVVDRTWLAHGASNEGLVAAHNAVKFAGIGNLSQRKRMDYRVLPHCNFTAPELAGVGLTEDEARAKGFDVKVGRFRYVQSGRAHAMGETEGMVKIIGDAKTDEILGVYILGAEAGELIAVAALAMSMEATVEEIVRTIHTHPTLAETIMEAAEDYYGHGIHTPPKA